MCEQVAQLKTILQGEKSDLLADRQKLIHAGKILKDDQTIGQLEISESDFIVCMITKEIAKVSFGRMKSAGSTLSKWHLDVLICCY